MIDYGFVFQNLHTTTILACICGQFETTCANNYAVTSGLQDCRGLSPVPREKKNLAILIGHFMGEKYTLPAGGSKTTVVVMKAKQTTTYTYVSKQGSRQKNTVNVVTVFGWQV